jgi:hypothetical protein
MKIINGKWLAASATALLVTMTPALVPEAAADHAHWDFGASFRLGNVHLTIGYQPVRYGAPTYYYRTHNHVHYDGYECSDRCYRSGRDYYHPESCPVVLHLLHLQRVHPHRLFARHASSYDGRFAGYDPYAFHRSYGRGHGSYGYRDHDGDHWRGRRGRGHDDRGRHRGRGRRH